MAIGLGSFHNLINLSTGEVGFGRGFIRGTENECVVILLLSCVDAFVLQMKKWIISGTTAAKERVIVNHHVDKVRGKASVSLLFFLSSYLRIIKVLRGLQ